MGHDLQNDSTPLWRDLQSVGVPTCNFFGSLDTKDVITNAGVELPEAVNVPKLADGA
ncbi:MAG: hypothetical protein Q9181_003942, partial [Wetmoreana brouardii]